ncbi:GGDEF domain-containing protein [Paenibacillus psychroresistens]|uniref:GGDEF domain-containing protein n=1 Tax=Paenibacillus psychroresistens TaxID=1778678 RepID=A0A6B8RVC3_9BACL|nr:GGDEF domain-containing protein [Paenibacillus psychroresistens]QGQ99719.1 GGDEF domain-containing protein [Paenibacillus psychroresistens]
MGLLVWFDLLLFFLLFALFVYIMASVTITNLHKIYLIFHFSMMVWPFCQFAIQTTDKPQFQLFYVKLAFVDTALISAGWLVFTIFLIGHSSFLRRKIALLLFSPALLLPLGAIFNPNGLFVLPVNGGYYERSYGILFWINFIILISYIIASLYIMFRTVKSTKSLRIKNQIKHVLQGILVLFIFIILDIILNVILAQYLPIIPGLTSLGILISAVFFVIAIHRDKVFDIVTIAHQDIIDTLALGILVLNEDETVVEINQSLLPHISLQIGDHFEIEAYLPHVEIVSNTDSFLDTYRNHPGKKAEIELVYTTNERRHVIIQAAPIMVSGTRVGRIVTIQNISELRRLIDETKLQNEILQERNQSLILIQEELFQTNQKLEQMALTDSMTGCYNRHYLTQQLEHEVMMNIRYQIPFAIFLLDIDFFKLVNDNYGHLVGDEVICSTVDAIKETLRRTDILARYGGEEFMIYLPHTTPLQASFLAERVKSAVEKNKIMAENVAHSLSITISMGIVSIESFEMENLETPKTYLNELFESVDKALYQAKNEGRNRIVSIVR